MATNPPLCLILAQGPEDEPSTAKLSYSVFTWCISIWKIEKSIQQENGPVRGQTWISIFIFSCMQCLLLARLFARCVRKSKLSRWHLPAFFYHNHMWNVTWAGASQSQSIKKRAGLKDEREKRGYEKETYVLLPHLWRKLIHECMA